MKMDKLIFEMNRNSFEILGQLFVTKIMQKDPEEQREVVTKMIDALYEPYKPRNQRLERLIGMLREIYDDLNEETSKSLTRQILQLCLDVPTHENSKKADSTAPLLVNGSDNDDTNKATKADSTDE